MDTNNILKIVTEHYLNSTDFNGISALNLTKLTKKPWGVLNTQILHLIQNDCIGLHFADVCINPHIKRIEFQEKEYQQKRAEQCDTTQTCIYPSANYLQSIVKEDLYRDKPYTRSLALGAPQLDFCSFDLSILEIYRNDPRYLYTTNSISGTISVRDEFYQSDNMQERDQVILQTFGFSYDNSMNRAVACFRRYLSRLSPEHQQIWKAKELSSDYKLHPVYFDQAIIGNFTVEISIFMAFAAEIRIINEMSVLMGRPHLFKNDYGRYGDKLHPNFTFLVRPTLNEYNNFVSLMDKMLSDNINVKFFKNEIFVADQITMSNGKVKNQSKGTLTILNEWMRFFFQTDNWSQWDESISALRDVRKQRQKPAHAIESDVFDQEYFKRQRELIINTYKALRTIRLIFAMHPLVKQAKIDIPRAIQEGTILDY